MEARTPREGLETLVRSAVAIVHRNRLFWQLSYQLRMQPDALADLGENLRFWSEAIRSRIEQLLQSAGRAEAPTEARVLFATIDGAAQHYVLDPERYPLERVAERIIHLFVPLCSARGTTPSCLPRSRGATTMSNPGWVDRKLYPFRSHFMEVEGGRMHYLDEGEGPPVVMVHGTPTWSFLFRHLVGPVSENHRVIAVDHIGFGLSDKPEGWSYRPREHAKNLAVLIERLGLNDVTLVVHDFGGPIGLSYAVEHPDNTRALVLFNTWMWSLAGTPAERMSSFMAGPIGRFLYRRLNLSPRVLVRALFGDKGKLTRGIHRHYIEAFPSPAERQAPWVLARELIGSTGWYEDLWQRRERIAGKPALLLWGMKDPAFGPDALARWREALGNARVVEFLEAGHFVPEEDPQRAVQEIRSFLSEPI